MSVRARCAICRGVVELGQDVIELLRAIQTGAHSAERSSPEAYYYAEPIKATRTCLPCHGEPRGGADPLFPEYTKDGWQDGEIVGAVIARVSPEV